MAFPAPSTPAGWLFTVLALFDVPMLVRELFNPRSNSQYFETSALMARLIAIVLLAINAYDLTAALNNDLTLLWVSCAARAAAMALPLPSSPTGWLFAIIAGISLPMHIHQVITPAAAMKQFDVNSVAARLIATFFAAINTYDLIAAVQNNFIYLYLSFATRTGTFCLFAMEGTKWRTAVTFEGLVLGVTILGLIFG
ncbi:hypothetical protein Asppvi_002072 [Aspergillus pseudoviridinutans]|uniref:Uncharacterized protein n=1 Tax=Aspergillus pseudoviridinutans TaxID=1517512 RepID=A0A9P3B7E2_9EURO|nr:uncharacterized protein Asppvi_002072 [Aspergillus pseudoviridinutans]GIJ83253.1 hypothetical protein Asppvi_002072 [Aspergillus pseudoviridinutans]